MAQIQAIAARHGLVVANVFHAGDGNLHPMICYDERIPGEFAGRSRRTRRSCTPASSWAGP